MENPSLNIEITEKQQEKRVELWPQTYLDDWVSHGSIFWHHRSVELTAEHGGIVVHIRYVYIHRGDGTEGGRASIASLHRQKVVSAGLIV